MHAARQPGPREEREDPAIQRTPITAMQKHKHGRRHAGDGREKVDQAVWRISIAQRFKPRMSLPQNGTVGGEAVVDGFALGMADAQVVLALDRWIDR